MSEVMLAPSSTQTITIPPKVARSELSRRELSKRHLVDFCEYVTPWYKTARHQKFVGEKLEQVETYIRTEGRTGIGRLLIMMPPRHGKSEEAMIHFPAYVLGKNPDSRLIITSYGLDLASKFSRMTRDIVMSERYANVFGQRSSLDVAVAISSDSRSVQAWDLASPHRGGMVAAGVGGGITGMGANLLGVDDPFKNREEAESEERRELVWNWWTSTAYTRLEDYGAVVGILTHWHGDDWAGRILKAMANNPRADQWEVVCLMAVWEEIKVIDGLLELKEKMMREGVWMELVDPLGRKPGEALWPEKYNEEDLARIRENIGTYEWQALYQQRPYSRAGEMFRRVWFVIVDEPPDEKDVAGRVRYWDKAGTKGAGAFTAGVCMSQTHSGLIYVEHVERGQWSTYEREEQIVRTARLDQEHRPGLTVIWHEQEGGSGGKDSAQYTNVKVAKSEFEAHFETVTGDKEVRAGPWSSIMEAGFVRLVRGGWNEEYINEHCSFPKGRYKDQVDASARAFAKLGNVLDGQLFY